MKAILDQLYAFFFIFQIEFIRAYHFLTGFQKSQLVSYCTCHFAYCVYMIFQYTK